MTAPGPGPLWLLRFRLGTNTRQLLQFRKSPLEGYRLEVRIAWGPREGILTEYLEDLGSALRIAQHYAEPVELWLADDHLCTIEKNDPGEGAIWTITPGRAQAKRRQPIGPRPRRVADPQPYRRSGTPRFQAKFCRIDGLEEIDMGDCVALFAQTPNDAECEAFRIGPPPGANAFKVLRDGHVILRRAYEALKSPSPHLQR